MAGNETKPGQAGGKLLQGANFAIFTIIVVGIIVLVNWFANQHDVHWDLTPNQQYSLSPQTIKVLKGLKQNLTIYVFDHESSFRRRRDLLGLYSSASHHVSLKFVDPDSNPSVARQFAVRSYGTVYVAAGDRHLAADATTEEAITNTIIKLLKGQKTIYFDQGHGEHNLDGTDRTGYQKFKAALTGENSAVKTLVLLQKPEVPADASLLVIAGPQNDFLPQEVDAIQKYLNSGGRVLFMLDPGVDLPNLGKMLSGEKVNLRNDLVIDENPIAQMFGTSASMPLILSYGTSPIVQPLARMATLFPLSRSFEVSTEDKPGVTVDALCKTSADSFSVTDFNPKMHQVSFRPGKDVKGPLVVALQGTIDASSGDTKKEGRFVALGTSLIAANDYLNFQGNNDLMMNVIDWLSSQEDLISIRPKPPTLQHLNLTASQMGGLLMRIIAIPLCVIIVGVFVWWGRR